MPNVSIYLVDYFKASDANTVLSAVNGQTITFAGTTGKIIIEKSARSRQSDDSSLPAQIDHPTLEIGGLSIGNKNSSFESLPTLSRRHSTTSFHHDQPSMPVTVQPEGEVSLPGRKLLHSVSEIDLRKKSQCVEPPSPSRPVLDKKNETIETQTQPAPTVLSPHAQPFVLPPSDSHPLSLSSQQHVSANPGIAFSPYVHSSSYYTHGASQDLNGSAYSHYYQHANYTTGIHGPHYTTSHTNPLRVDTHAMYYPSGQRSPYEASSPASAIHSPHVNISHGLMSPASSTHHRQTGRNFIVICNLLQFAQET